MSTWTSMPLRHKRCRSNWRTKSQHRVRQTESRPPSRCEATQLRIKKLQAAQAEWSRKRTERIDFINEELRRQGHAVRTFKDVDDAMRLYAQVAGKNVSLADLGPEPQLFDFYQLSDDQKEREIAFIILGMAATGFVAYILAK
ncbi:MAG: hypothetical protein N0E48_04915 [Candidatus Thiodiazotropha endolucinida]|nr:hypothetical protein [Candidatus Thiodiazotropha endolucinida]